MQDLASDIWMRTGTSLVWDVGALNGAARAGCTVSLREALGWLPLLPDEPPGGVHCVVVTGLQSIIDVLPPAAAAALLSRVHALVRRQPRDWPETALVFALVDGSRLQLGPATNALTLLPQGGPAVDIGARLWGGAAPDACRLVSTKGKAMATPIGYWLRRVS